MKVRIKEVEVKGYMFPGYDGLYWHSGDFWFNEEVCKKVVNNGSLSILINGQSKKSVSKLRKIAKECVIKLEKDFLPF